MDKFYMAIAGFVSIVFAFFYFKNKHDKQRRALRILTLDNELKTAKLEIYKRIKRAKKYLEEYNNEKQNFLKKYDTTSNSSDDDNLPPAN